MKTIVKDLKKIILIQERTIRAEKNVSKMLFGKLVRNDHLILNSDYNYLCMEDKLNAALKEANLLKRILVSNNLSQKDIAKKKLSIKRKSYAKRKSK
tara:strand:- start:10 stop:300 length:291 start_codon:yes stop_codon:yes gene_type:complete